MSGKRSGRILALLELVDEAPTADELGEYLDDPDPDVRRTALTVLSEATGDWAAASPVFAAALADPAAAVRQRAAELLGELREVLLPGERFTAALREAAVNDDPAVRVAAVGALWRHRLTSVAELTGLMTDPEQPVRREVILGLVSLDALGALGQASADPSPNVRIAVAKGIASVGDPRGAATLATLAGDADPLVRAAALAGMADIGCTGHCAAIAVAALDDPAWQVRQAAASALAAADPAIGVEPLIRASGDENLDVRKAAARALGPRLAGRPQVRAALQIAESDADADVRAHARMALAAPGLEVSAGPGEEPQWPK